MASRPESYRSATDESEGAPNFTVFGAPAPRCSRRSPPPKSRVLPPLVSPPLSRSFTLPVDRIFLLQDRLNESLGCDLISDRESSISSSHRDLSLDLSSVNDSAHETDSDDDVPGLPSKKRSAKKYQKNGYWSCQSSSSTQDSPPRLETRPVSSQSFRRSSDLICLYVDTVNNTELAKYFRPCVTCKETSCCCPAAPVEDLTSSRCSDFSQFLLERRYKPPEGETSGTVGNEVVEPAFDSGNSTLQLDETSRSSVLSHSHVSLSLMQLSTAAQCARILADSLDSILQLARDEVSSLAGSQRQPMISSRNIDDLPSALETLRRNYPQKVWRSKPPDLQSSRSNIQGKNVSSESYAPARNVLSETKRNVSSETSARQEKMFQQSWRPEERNKSAPALLTSSFRGEGGIPVNNLGKQRQNMERFGNSFEDEFCCKHCPRKSK